MRSGIHSIYRVSFASSLTIIFLTGLLCFSNAWGQQPDPLSVTLSGPKVPSSAPDPQEIDFPFATIPADSTASAVIVEPSPVKVTPAVPRPVTKAAQPMASPYPVLPEITQPSADPYPVLPEVVPDQPESIRVPFPPVKVIGIDRSDFPKILLVVALRDEEGEPVINIDQEALKISEDEAPQYIDGVAPCIPEFSGSDPLSVMILIDSSGSMQQYITVVQSAAARFVSHLRKGDYASVIAFCNQPVMMHPLTDSKKFLHRAIYKISPRGFTALYDSLDIAVRALQNCQGRRAIVLLTDGRDDDGSGRKLSRTNLDSVLARSQKAEIPIYSIGLGKDISRSVLEQMANETGGDFFFAPSGDRVDDLYREVARKIGRGDEGYFAVTYSTTLEERDATNRTLIVNYEGAFDYASYPAPSQMIWPLSKVLD